jgi:DedD protein
MAIRSDAPDPAVDELRRKARRRLVGAVVLALAAAVLLPLLLENEPKPLGDDVSIQIPPVDSGKFVNPLSPAPPPASAQKADKPAGANLGASPQTPSSRPAPKSEPPASSSTTPPPIANASPASSEKASEAKSVAPSESAPDVKPSPGAETESDVKPDAKPEAKTEARSDAAKATAGYVVQVAAFADRFGARSLVAKLKKSGFPGYTETVTTDKGTLHRVRVGPYASREVADAARAKLKAAGFAGVVARSG